MFHNFVHSHDSARRETIQVPDLVQSTLLTAFSHFHTIERHHHPLDLHAALRFENWECLFDRLAGSGHILDDYDSVAILKPASQKDTGVTMILYLLAVRAVADVFAV